MTKLPIIHQFTLWSVIIILIKLKMFTRYSLTKLKEDVFDKSYCCCGNLQQKKIDFKSSLMIWDLFDLFY